MTRYIGLGADTTQQAIDEGTKAASQAIADSVAERGTRTHRIAQGATQWSMKQLDAQIDAFKKTQAGKIVWQSGQVADSVTGMVNAAKKGDYTGDASGVFNVARDGFNLIENTANLAVMISASSEAVAREVVGWASVGASCAAGASVAGWGWLACGLSVIAKMFDYVGAAPYQEAWTTPRTVFKPDQASAGLIAQDALRLAQVLKHHYGVRSFAEMYSRLGGGKIDTFKWLLRETGVYPYAPRMVNGRIITQQGAPVPGHNLRTILQLVDFKRDAEAAHDNTRDGLAVLAGYRSGLEPAGRGLFLRYESDHDINQRSIANGAYFARAGIGTQGHARLRCDVTRAGDLSGWPKVSAQFYARVLVDFRPFLIVDELINFFGAITARELVTIGLNNRQMLINSYGFGTNNPTKHLFVSDLTGQQTGGGSDPQRAYSNVCWTNLSRATGTNCMLQNALISGSVSDEVLREAGAIRLMAAFSYLQQDWMWSSNFDELRQDPISRVAAIPRDALGVPTNPADEMALPVDPRQAFGTNLATEEVPTSPRHGTIGRQYAQLAAQDGSALAFFVPGSNGYVSARRSPSYLHQLIAKRASLIQNILKKASVFIAQPIWYVAKTPEEARAAVTQMWLEARAKGVDIEAALRAAQQPSGAGAAVLLGAAALLALKFLK